MFEVYQLTFTPAQVRAKKNEKTLINPDAVTSPLGTAAAPSKCAFPYAAWVIPLPSQGRVEFQCTVQVEEIKGI